MKGVSKGFRNAFVWLFVLTICSIIGYINISRIKRNYTGLHERVQTLEKTVNLFCR